jgi:hypothetical protein
MRNAPLHRAVQRSGDIVAIPILAGLHHHTSGYDFRKGQGPLEPLRKAILRCGASEWNPRYR